MKTNGRRDEETTMRVVMAAALLAGLAAFAGCGGDDGPTSTTATPIAGGPLGAPPAAATECTFDPRTTTQDVRVTSAVASDANEPDCVAIAADFAASPTTRMQNGAILGAPVMLTSIREGQCTWEIAGFAQLPVSDLGCIVTIGIAATVVR